MSYRIILKSQKTNAKKNDGPKEYTCQFWEPGLVSYEDSGAGKALLRKESMDKILPSFVGKPVTIDHVEGSPDEIMNAGRAVGTVTNAYWNPDTGWYECKFTVENEDARKKVESGWSVSCAFDVAEQTGPGGEYHAIPFDEEITSGTFTHLALVENPRYEDSKIFKNHKMRLNAKGVKMQNAKTVLISIPYRLLERDDDKNPDQELQARGLRNVGGGGGVADFEFNGTESQAAAIVKQVLGTVSGVDIGMMNSKRNSDATNKEYDAILKEIQSIHVMTKEKAEAMIAKIDASSLGSSEKDNLEYNLGKQRARSHGKENDSSDFGTILREIKEQLYQMAQALGSKFSGKENATLSDVQKEVLAWMREGNVGAIPSDGKWLFPEHIRQDDKLAAKILAEIKSGKRNAKEETFENDYSLKIHTINSNFVGVIYKDGAQIETTGQYGTEDEVKAEAQKKVAELKSKQNSGEPYSVSIEHRPEERGGDVYRVALIKDGKEADHILVKGDAAAQDQKRKWLRQYNQKQNDAFGENIIRVKFRTKRGSTEEKYTTVEEFSSEANARIRASALNWDIISSEPIKKNSRVILKPGKSNSTQEKKPMFGLFKRKSKKNDQEAAPAKLPLEQIDVEIDGVAVPLSELVTGYRAEQAEVAEKQKLEQAQAAKEVTEAPAPEANADNTAPEDLNLDNQEFSVEDGSRFNMTELVDSYNRRKAAKCNAEKEKEKDDYLNALDFGDGKSETEARAKLKEMGYSDAEADQAIKTKKEGQAAADAAKKNASETPEEKAAKENAAAEEAKKKADEEAAAKAKENAKKDPKYFHKLNDLKNAGEVITGKAIETLSDKIERGNARYGSKKK